MKKIIDIIKILVSVFGLLRDLAGVFKRTVKAREVNRMRGAYADLKKAKTGQDKRKAARRIGAITSKL